MRPSTLIACDYAAFVADLKTRVASARLAATRAVNSELVGLYWDTRVGLRPDEAATLETLGQQQQSLAIEPEHLEDVAAPAAEDAAAERVGGQRGLHHCGQTVAPQHSTAVVTVVEPIAGCVLQLATRKGTLPSSTETICQGGIYRPDGFESNPTSLEGCTRRI